MHQVPRADQIELADAIAEGARRRPNQAFGEYFSTKGGSCALGAAYEGLLHNKEDYLGVVVRWSEASEE